MFIFVPILSAAAWLTIEVMVLINPSGIIPLGNLNLNGWIFFLVSAAASFILPFFAIYQKKRSRFFFWFFLSLIVLLFTSNFAGRKFHRDFDSYIFEIILLFYVIFVLKLDSLSIVKRKLPVFKTLTLVTIIVFILWIFWLMMMAYAVVTRAEPRWLESTAYNLINGLIGLIIAASAVSLWDRGKRKLHFRAGRLYLDELEISSTLSPQECSFITAFLQVEDATLNCRQLFGYLNSEDSAMLECNECTEKKWKATACANYRNYKNRISDVKKYLELLQIGTIVPISENPRAIKNAGWRLRLFDDVHFVHGSYKRAPGTGQMAHVRQ